MDVTTHISILGLLVTYLGKLIDMLRRQLVMIEQALAEQAQPTYAQAALHSDALLERSQQLVLEFTKLHARMKELAAKSKTGSDNSEQTPIPILAQP